MCRFLKNKIPDLFHSAFVQQASKHKHKKMPVDILRNKWKDQELYSFICLIVGYLKFMSQKTLYYLVASGTQSAKVTLQKAIYLDYAFFFLKLLVIHASAGVCP